MNTTPCRACATASSATTVSDISNYIKRGKLLDAFTSEQRPVLLIDEIDKADIDFRTTCCSSSIRLEFFVYETGARTSRRSCARS